MKDLKLTNLVKDKYRKIALNEEQVKSKACCNQEDYASKLIAQSVGYDINDVINAPEGTNMGLQCGNPIEFANLIKGEVVLDLGSGGGFDAFLASKKVGDTGKVFGVDMLPEMVLKASIALKDYKNIEFKVSQIEDLPIEDNSIDCIISNCVINLSTDKKKVYEECYRVLKPGGRLCVSDIINIEELPQEIKDNEDSYCNWVSGASSVDELKKMIKGAGFRAVNVKEKDLPKEYLEKWGSEDHIERYVKSSITKAVK